MLNEQDTKNMKRISFDRCHHHPHRRHRHRRCRRLSDVWHTIILCESTVCVWQLVNLIHAINYVVPLTDATRVYLSPKIKTDKTHIFASCQYNFFFLISCANFFIFLLLYFSLSHSRPSIYFFSPHITHDARWTSLLRTCWVLLIVLPFTSTSLSQHMRASLVQNNHIVPHIYALYIRHSFAVVQFNENFNICTDDFSGTVYVLGCEHHYHKHEKDEMSLEKWQ